VSELLTEIKNYYSRNNIRPSSYSNFKCPSKKSCLGKCQLLTTGTEPFIGSKYEERERPRLLIISAEPAEGDPNDWESRTIKGHGGWWERAEKNKINRPFCKHDNDEACTKCLGENTGFHPRSHWFKTSQMAVWVFQVIQERKLSRWVWDVKRRAEYPSVAPYWAHTNSGKCSQNLSGHKQASARLFKNCRPYLGREVRILDPDIIVTQGIPARKALNAAVEWREIENISEISLTDGSCHRLFLRNHPVLWIVMPHPNSQHNRHYGLIRTRLPYLAAHIKQLLLDHDTSS
jgi:hypothetical protein